MSRHGRKHNRPASRSLIPMTLERPASAPTLERGSDQPPAGAVGVLVWNRCFLGGDFKPSSAAKDFYLSATLNRRIVPTLRRGNVPRTLPRPVDSGALSMPWHVGKTGASGSNRSSLIPRTLERPASAPTLQLGRDQPPANSTSVPICRRSCCPVKSLRLLRPMPIEHQQQSSAGKRARLLSSSINQPNQRRKCGGNVEIRQPAKRGWWRPERLW